MKQKGQTTPENDKLQTPNMYITQDSQLYLIVLHKYMNCNVTSNGEKIIFLFYIYYILPQLAWYPVAAVCHHLYLSNSQNTRQWYSTL